MRFLLAVVAIVAVVGMAAFAEQSGDKSQGTQVCPIKVSGMFCGQCAKTVEKAAKKIDGVKAAKVSQPKGIAEITYDPAKTNPEAIAKAISERTAFKAEVQSEPKK